MNLADVYEMMREAPNSKRSVHLELSCWSFGHGNSKERRSECTLRLSLIDNEGTMTNHDSVSVATAYHLVKQWLYADDESLDILDLASITNDPRDPQHLEMLDAVQEEIA